ncbi:hypothetical protein F183_A00160 [Bryobacterales bacterium F-183]|nr:hypothetical protein F183_A00160 [Bryobacterales bacterium F-183]
MALLVWTIWLATACYLTALRRRSRALWTAGLALYLAHVFAAFHYVHHWSHQAAYEDTARQTRELYGVDFGGSGLYCNYAFTLLWAFDVAWWWKSPESRQNRPKWQTWAIQGYLAFIVVNGALIVPLLRLFRS